MLDGPAPQLSWRRPVQLGRGRRAEPLQRIDRIPRGSAAVHGARPGLFRQLLPRGGQDRHVQIAGLGKPERLLQVALCRHAFEQIPPSDDRRDALITVVDHDGEVIGRQSVTAPDHVVAKAGRSRSLDAALEQVFERWPCTLYAHPDRRIVSGEPQRAARTGISGAAAVLAREGAQLASTTPAAEGAAGDQEAFAFSGVHLEATTLLQHRSIPLERMGLERAKDVIGCTGKLAGRVDIFDPDEPLSA